MLGEPVDLGQQDPLEESGNTPACTQKILETREPGELISGIKWVHDQRDFTFLFPFTHFVKILSQLTSLACSMFAPRCTRLQEFSAPGFGRVIESQAGFVSLSIVSEKF